MAPKITYLLGAGASSFAHPLAKSTPDSRSYSEALYSFIVDNRNVFNEALGGVINFEDIFKKYTAIADKCRLYGTPDTYAKWLYENNHNENYNCLKKLISTYFSYNDHKLNSHSDSNNKKDYRALPFLTSILENGKLPENIKLVSWNYDSQIEIAAQNNTSHVNKYLKGFTSWPNSINSNDPSFIRENKEPFLLHLNGLAGFKYNKMLLAEESITPFIELAATNHEPLLSFSWEVSNSEILPGFNLNRLEVAKNMVKSTEYLVIVGYSFPFFNRKVDKLLLEEMSPSLRKIYYQEPNKDILPEDLINKFDVNIPADKIKMIRDVGQFYIPHEL
jgi:hypothetical protein